VVKRYVQVEEKVTDVTDLIEAQPATAMAPCVRDTHEVFAQALARHGNKLAAYREAFPEAAPSTASVEAYRLANHKDVARRVHELQKARRAALLAETAELEAVVSNLCHGKATKLVDEQGQLIPFHLLPTEVQAAIRGLKLKVSRDGDGNITTEYEVTFPDPLAALRLLAQLRGVLVERHDHMSAGKPLQPALDPASLPQTDAELRRQLITPTKYEDIADLLSKSL
jgi:Terminase small subunit